MSVFRSLKFPSARQSAPWLGADRQVGGQTVRVLKVRAVGNVRVPRDADVWIDDRNPGERISSNTLSHLGPDDLHTVFSGHGDDNLWPAMARLNGLRRVFVASRANDRTAHALATLSRLEMIYLDGASLSDEGLEHLQGHPGVKELMLSSPLIGGKATAELICSLPALHTLTIYASERFGEEFFGGLTDAGENLRYVNLPLCLGVRRTAWNEFNRVNPRYSGSQAFRLRGEDVSICPPPWVS